MFGFTRNLWFALILCSFHFSSSSTFDLKKLESLDVDNVKGDIDQARASNYYDYEDDLELSVGAIIGIGIAGIVLVCGVPILLCFCCACCCFRNRGNKSTVVVAAPAPQQYVPQQYNHAAMHNQTVTVNTQNNGPPPTNVANQNAYRDNMGFSFYPGSGDNLQATQSNQYYNYNGVSAPPPNPRFTTKNQTPNYEQQPPYFNATAQSAQQYQYRQYQYQPPMYNEAPRVQLPEQPASHGRKKF